MRNTLVFSFLLLLTFTLSAQQTVPSTTVKTLEGENVDIKDLVTNEEDKLTVLSFWATWCSPCKKELDAISELYPYWMETYNVELLAITIDNTRAFAKVPGIVLSKGWDYTVLSDTNGDTQRTFSFPTIPQTYLVNSAGEIIYEHNGYSPGAEYELEDQIIAARSK